MHPARIRHLSIRLSAMRVLPHALTDEGYVDTVAAARVMKCSRECVLAHAHALGYAIAPSHKNNASARDDTRIDTLHFMRAPAFGGGIGRKESWL